MRSSHQSSSDSVACLETTSTSSTQPELNTRMAGKKTATFALRATGWLTASKTPASRPGGLEEHEPTVCLRRARSRSA